MSKAKKEAYAAKQKATTATDNARELTPLGGTPVPADPKKAKQRKQSRGK